jgi:tetratricopeptide (TPR) repeat protein
LHRHIGESYLEHNLPREALDHLMAALVVWPNDDELLYNLGIAELAAGKLANAITHLKRSHELAQVTELSVRRDFFSVSWAVLGVVFDVSRLLSAVWLESGGKVACSEDLSSLRVPCLMRSWCRTLPRIEHVSATFPKTEEWKVTRLLGAR